MLRDHLGIGACTRTKTRQDNQMDLEVTAELAGLVAQVAQVALAVARAAPGVLVQVRTVLAEALAQWSPLFSSC